MEQVYKIIDIIDDELLKLHQASTKTGAKYSHFNFKQALQSLNNEFLKHGMNDYTKIKASQYINVFHDLCNTEAECCFYRTISFDPISKELETEHFTHDLIKHTNEKKTINSICPPELLKFHSEKVYPEKETKKLLWLCKFEYLIQNCDVSYERVDAEKQFVGDEFDQALRHIVLSKYILTREDKFDNYFKIDINFVMKHRLSFEEYIQQLLQEKMLNLDSKKEAKPQNDEFDFQSAIEKFIPQCISVIQEEELKYFIIQGKTKNNPINITGTLKDFYSIIVEIKEHIPTKYYPSWYDMICNNFTLKGKNIPKTSLSNYINPKVKK